MQEEQISLEVYCLLHNTTSCGCLLCLRLHSCIVPENSLKLAYMERKKEGIERNKKARKSIFSYRIPLRRKK